MRPWGQVVAFASDKRTLPEVPVVVAVNRGRDEPTGKRMSAKTLRLHLRAACRQIDKFRRECDPNEEKVLVTAVEMMGESAFTEDAKWYEF